MRISDWSSDVCSSDLCKPGRNCGAGQGLDGFWRQARAFRGFQWRRRDPSEVVAEQDLSAVGAMQEAIVPQSCEFCREQKDRNEKDAGVAGTADNPRRAEGKGVARTEWSGDGEEGGSRGRTRGKA